MERQHGRASCQRQLEWAQRLAEPQFLWSVEPPNPRRNLRRCLWGQYLCRLSDWRGGRCRRNSQTVWESTSTLQYKPFPSLIRRAAFRHEKSDKNVFLSGSRLANHQETLSCQWPTSSKKTGLEGHSSGAHSGPVSTKTPTHSAA